MDGVKTTTKTPGRVGRGKIEEISKNPQFFVGRKAWYNMSGPSKCR